MKQLTVLLLLASLMSCSGHSKPHVSPRVDSTYLMFVLDAKVHSVAVAWGIVAAVDTPKIVNNNVVSATDTFYFVNWPVTIMDSLRKHVLINSQGHDSTQLKWVSLKPWAVLKDLGRGPQPDSTR